MDERAGAEIGLGPPRRHARHGRLRPGELAEAAVLGDLALVLEVIGWFAPLGGIFQALAVIPFSLLSSRHRLRTAVVATVATASVAFLVGGVGIVIQTGIAGALGCSIGVAHRRRWPALVAIFFTTAVAGLPLIGASLVIDWISPGFRRLSFAQIRILWRDAAHVLNFLQLKHTASAGTTVLNWAITHWYESIPAAEALLVLVVAIALTRIRPFLDEVRRNAVAPVDDEPPGRVIDAPVEPVPARFECVSYRYPGTDTDAVANVSFEVAPGQLLALVGPNGSGKSTLVRLLVGRSAPSEGSVRRPGIAGLGQPGGTAVVFQRPESQVLGVRVRDDVIWGLPAGTSPDVAGLLERVGLGGFEERETSTLSGGELQRLAIAAALARRPRLLVSDEATAMIDAEGRREVTALLKDLASSGMAVVHVTHRVEEAERADKVVRLLGGRIVGDDVAFSPAEDVRESTGPSISPKPAPRRLINPPLPAADPPASSRPHERREARPLVSIRQAGYVYSEGTPWARRALEGVDLEIATGDGLVITGPNGSGKSTLAWLLAGLTIPTEGEVLMGGSPLAEQQGRAGITFQHARLQLLRPRVLNDVMLGADEVRARRALQDVGFDPDEMGPRRVDELSGGEQRRVALAGLLVREPDLVVLDEPYAGLDTRARRSLAHILGVLRRTRGMAVVVVSHDLDDAELLGDRLVSLAGGRLTAEEMLGAAS